MKTGRYRMWMASGLIVALALGASLPVWADTPELVDSQTIGDDDDSRRIAIELTNPEADVPYDADAFGDGVGGWLWSNATPNAVTGVNLGDHSLGNNQGGNIRLDLNGGDLLATSGYISTDVTSRYDSPKDGGIVIRNVGEIAMGDGYLSQQRVVAQNSPYLHIGEETEPAGSVQVARIDASLDGFGWNDSFPNSIVIHSQGDVLIQDADGVAGDLLGGGRARSDDDIWDGCMQTAITIRHHGDLKAGRITFGFRNSENRTTALTTLFDGAHHGSTTNGSFTSGEIDGRTIADEKNAILDANNLKIRNYRSVTITRILLDKTGSTLNFGYEGNIDITNIAEDIRIVETASSLSTHDEARCGYLNMQAGGTITIGSLDLSRVLYAKFNAGEEGHIQDEIIGDDGEPLSGDGSTLNNTGNKLRAPAGIVVYYRPEDNPDLEEGEYTLADLNGTADAGGELKPFVPSGTVFIVK